MHISVTAAATTMPAQQQILEILHQLLVTALRQLLATSDLPTFVTVAAAIVKILHSR